jgi:small subunit ribosomal protein S3e
MGIMRFVIESGAKGVEVLVSGKIRGQRGKCMKFRDGYMLKSGDAKHTLTDQCTRHVALRAGTIGIKMRIMLPHDPEGLAGSSKPHPDVITVLPPKEATA